MLAPLIHRFKKGHPSLVKLDEHLITHFTWKGLIGFMGLDLVKNLDIIEIDALVNEGLTDHIVGCVPEVFRSKGGLIDLLVAGITFLDNMLLNYPHGFSPGCRVTRNN